MLFLAADLANPQALWEKLLAFLTDFDAMFPGFSNVALKAQKPFFLIAFVMVVHQLVQRLSGSGSRETQVRAVVSAAVFALCVALSNSGAALIRTGFTFIQQEMGAENSSPDLVEAKKEELIVAMTAGVEQKVASGTGDSKGSLYYLTHWGDAIDKGIDSLVPSIGGLIVQAASFLLIFFSKLSSLIAWGFWLIQQFLFTFSLIFLPAMVAMMGVGSLRSIGTRYVMSIVGLLAWPMGWGLVNVGTEAMLTSAVNTVKSAPASDWEITTYLWAIAIVAIIPFWMVLGYAFVPFVIQRMVTSGANAASGLIGQTGGAAIGAGAAILTGGVSLAAGGASGAGGGTAAAGGAIGGGDGNTGAAGGGSSGRSGQGSGGGGSVSSGSGPSGGNPMGNPGNGNSPGGGGSEPSVSSAAGAVAAAAAVAQQPFEELARESGNPSPVSLTPSSSAAHEAVKRRQQARAFRPVSNPSAPQAQTA